MKPFEEAKYLLCQDRNVSGLDIAATLRDSTEVTSPVLFYMALLLIGDAGKVMILEQDTVVLLDCYMTRCFISQIFALAAMISGWTLAYLRGKLASLYS